MSTEPALDRLSSLVEQEASERGHIWSLAYWMKCDRLSSGWKYWKAEECWKRSLGRDVNDS